MSTNFSEMCRFCMGRETNMSHLYLEENNIIEKVLAFVPLLKILAGDGLPEQACSRCIYRINDCCSFKQLCEESDKSLRQLRTQKLEAETRVGESDEMKKVSQAGNFFVVKVEDVKEELIIEDSDEFCLNNTDSSIDESQHNSAPADDRTFVAALLKQDQEQSQNQVFVLEERLQPCSSSTNSNFKKDTLTQPFIHDPLQDSPCRYFAVPKNREHTTRLQSWSSSRMREAISAVRGGSMGCKKASKIYGVPRTTLKRRVNNLNIDATEDKKILGKRPVFTSEQEKELVDYALRIENMFYGLTRKEIRKIAFQLAEKNNLNHPFNKNTGLAGEDWFAGFRKRHPELNLRSPEATSIAMVQGFNKVSVGKFFELFKNIMDEKHYPPHRIFNVDETGITTVKTKSHKVLARRRKKQVGAVISAEQDVLSTAVICMSAGGTFIPPMLVFPLQRMKADLKDGAPPGTVFSCNGSGWIHLETFGLWFEHFLKYVNPTNDDPALLIMDGHMTHIKNLDMINQARQNNITFLTIPPHCSHKLQPLDVSFMGPLNTFYVAAIEKFHRDNPGRAVTQYQISKLFGDAYLKAANSSTAISGFRKCGIFPVNPNIFQDSDLLPSLPSERPISEELHSPVSISPNQSINRPEESDPVTSISTDLSTPVNSLKPSPSFQVTSEAIMPIPKSNQPQSSKRKSSSDTILTSSHYKIQLVEKR